MRRMVLLREQVREGTLLVVNRQHPLRSSQKIELINVGNGVQMERHAAAAFNECVRLVGGRETIVPVSGWRSAQEQKKIWDDTMRKEGAAQNAPVLALGTVKKTRPLEVEAEGIRLKSGFFKPDGLTLSAGDTVAVQRVGEDNIILAKVVEA